MRILKFYCNQKTHTDPFNMQRLQKQIQLLHRKTHFSRKHPSRTETFSNYLAKCFLFSTGKIENNALRKNKLGHDLRLLCILSYIHIVFTFSFFFFLRNCIERKSQYICHSPCMEMAKLLIFNKYFIFYNPLW